MKGAPAENLFFSRSVLFFSSFLLYSTPRWTSSFFRKEKRKSSKFCSARLSVTQPSFALCHGGVRRILMQGATIPRSLFFTLGFVVGAVLLSETIHPNDPLKFKGNYSNRTSSTGEKVATCHPVDMKALSVFAQRTLIAPCFFVVEISLAN